MKHYLSLLALVLVLSTTLTSCEVIGGIFEAGFWTAIIVIVLVIALVIWLLSRLRGRR